MFLPELLDMASGDPRRIDEKTIKETARSRGITAEDPAKRRETTQDPQPVPQQTRTEERTPGEKTAAMSSVTSTGVVTPSYPAIR